MLQKRNEYLAKEIRKNVSQCDYGDINSIISDMDSDNVRNREKYKETAHQEKVFHQMVDEFNENASKLKELTDYIADIETILMDDIDLGVKVRTLRDQCGMSLLEIAEKLEYSYQHIRRVYSKSKE